MSTGLKRNIIDKYYTKQSVVKYCIDLFKKNIKINKKKDLIIEPSAGNGSFIPFIKKLTTSTIFYDLKPDHKGIIKQNYLKLNPKLFLNKYNKIHIIGNPPFGRQSSTAIKFIKKSCEFCDTISFILPKSFKKASLKSKIPLNFHLVVQKDLPKNSFTVNSHDYDVPCIFQIWIKKSFKRKKPIRHRQSQLFTFVKKHERPDVAIRRIGSNAGKVYEDYEQKNTNSHYFIKIHNGVDKNKIIKYNYKSFNNTVGPLSISKQELIIFYDRYLQAFYL